MAGVRRFDAEAVLDRLMRVFWERGYRAASIDDLVAASGLKRGSLYNAFGDKERMFRAAFARYLEQVDRPLRAALDDDEPRRALATVFRRQIDGFGLPDRPTGCLSVGAGAEAGICPAAVTEAIRDHVAASETAVYKLLLRGQAKGHVAAGRDLRALARFFVAVSRALAQLDRAGADRQHLEDVAGTALTVLDAEPTGLEDPHRPCG